MVPFIIKIMMMMTILKTSKDFWEKVLPTCHDEIESTFDSTYNNDDDDEAPNMSTSPSAQIEEEIDPEEEPDLEHSDIIKEPMLQQSSRR